MPCDLFWILLGMAGLLATLFNIVDGADDGL